MGYPLICTSQAILKIQNFLDTSNLAYVSIDIVVVTSRHLGVLNSEKNRGDL